MLACLQSSLARCVKVSSIEILTAFDDNLVLPQNNPPSGSVVIYEAFSAATAYQPNQLPSKFPTRVSRAEWYWVWLNGVNRNASGSILG